MKGKDLKWITLSLVAGIIIYLGASKVIDVYIKKTVFPEREPEKKSLRGTALPSFTLLLPDSITYFNTSKISPGKPIALIYFSPDCPYCNVQIRDIVKEVKLLKDIQFYVFTPYPFADMKKFYGQYRLDKYSNIVVGRDYQNFFGKYFKTHSVPYIVIYDKNKLLKEAFAGNIDVRQIHKVVHG